MEKNIRIGWAQTDITPDRPIYVIGQLYSRISSYVHDPLTATCLALENGEEQMILVSADMPGVPTMHISRILERLDAPGLDRSRQGKGAGCRSKGQYFYLRRRRQGQEG